MNDTRKTTGMAGLLAAVLCSGAAWAAEEFPKPYSPPCVERENVFEFAEKPTVKNLGNDKYEITFAVKANCDVTVGIIDDKGVVVRHLGSGVLGANAPAPFQKNSLKQTIYWNGKDDLGAYHKTPEKLKVRVMLGLKPVFDKRLGGTSPYNLPGLVMGLAVGPDAAYVLSRSSLMDHKRVHIRKFDRDGKYVCSLVPPPATLPETKLGGMGFVEYEAGKRDVHGADLTASINSDTFCLPPLDGEKVVDCQPALIGNRLFFANVGQTLGSPGSLLHYIYTDGSTDVRGINGVPLAKGVWHNSPRLAVSPDGKKIYLCPGYSLTSSRPYDRQPTCLYVTTSDGDGPAALFAGEAKTLGSDNQHFGTVAGIDCDAQGRIYASDGVNNRVQVLSPEGKYLKTIPVDRPGIICVHKKTGAIYVLHQARVEGRSVSRLTKFMSFDDPKEEYHKDGLDGWMALDSWSDTPRLWLAQVEPEAGKYGAIPVCSVAVWEERKGKLEKLLDFNDEARKDSGWFTRWFGQGSLGNSKSVCDPVLEKLYYANVHVFDLATGKHEAVLRLPGQTDDIAFDKRGYLHAHFYPGFMQGVGRFDPRRGYDFVDAFNKIQKGLLVYPECPYDYGIERGPLLGVLPVKDQKGAKTFQDGLGANMRGDVASECNIYYVPKMDDEAKSFSLQGSASKTRSGTYNEEGLSYESFLRSIKDAEKQGEEVYFIRRSPGIPLMGGMVWTFDRTGELRKACAVNGGKLLAGVQLDEDMSVYFVNALTRVYNDRPFLYGRGGHFGVPASKHLPFTGTLIKTKPDTQMQILMKKAPVPMDSLPTRPAELASISFPDDDADNKDLHCWVEGAEWLYAGASPIPPEGCSCPSMRLHLDWYKRVYVPESYRHSIGILDTNGNLIMHLGRYANFDGAPGGKDGCKPGETDIGITCARYIGGTDNYLAFEDWGERLVVLKLNYHAEETVGIGKQ